MRVGKRRIRVPRPESNPIVVKELRSRMRGWRAFAILTAVLVLLGGSSYALYRIVLSTSRYSTTPVSPQIGQVLFFGLAFLELFMVCLVTPAVTAGAVSGEQERQTLEMLLATPLRPGRILRGKLISSLSYVFLLVFAAVPMASLVFIFGGVAPKEMLKALVLVVCVAVMLGVVGVFASVWLGRTTRATVASYMFVLGLVVLPYVVYVLVGVIQEREPPRWILVPTPVSALASALAPSAPMQGSTSFLGQIGWVLSGSLSLVRGERTWSGSPRPLYHYTLAVYGVLSIVLYGLSARLVRPTRRWRLRWREVLAGSATLLLFVGAAAGALVATSGRYGTRVATTPTPAPMNRPSIVERVVAVPVEPEAPLEPAPGALTDEARGAIYAQVVRQLYTVDHTFDVAPQFPVVYLVRSTDDGVGDPDAPQDPSVALSDQVRDAVLAELATYGLPAEFVWVGSRDDVPVDEQGSVKGGGVVMTLGNIHLREDGSALVAGSLHFAVLGAGGRTYLLEQVDGEWRVTGYTGVQWIS
ncbi:MAG: ABC transporter permease [Anaerolineae bacterium]|nr:ABC transporter permease [Anaerolineae bacterium]